MTIQETRAVARVPPGRATVREITMVMGAGQVVLTPTLRGLVVQEAQAAARGAADRTPALMLPVVREVQAAAREAAVRTIVRIVLQAVALPADQAAAQMAAPKVLPAAPVERAEEAVVNRMDRTLR